MDSHSAAQALEDVELVPCVEATIVNARELEAKLLSAEIPAALGAAPKKACCGSGGCGCGAKVQLLVRKEDLLRVSELLQRDWLEAVQREGLGEVSLVPLTVPEG